MSIYNKTICPVTTSNILNYCYNVVFYAPQFSGYHFMCIKETIQLKTIKELIRQIQRCHYKKGGGGHHFT